jgi:general secretion pathway protein D
MAVVDKLDIRRAQVLVEAIIVDVQMDKNAELGVNWAVWQNEDSDIPLGTFQSPVAGVNLAQLALAVDNPSNAATIAPGLGNGTTFGIGRIAATGVNFAAMIRAVQGDSNTNLISTPSAVTMDNQEAQLKVAQEVPFITGQFTSTGNTNNGEVNPFTTVQRQEVGTILKITPQVNEGGALVQLKINIESSALSGTTGDANSAITNKRTIDTNVLIEDGGIVVLGGLIQDGDTRGEQRVPYLGRIPVIGELFKTRSRKREKRNLMVFIRPKILRDGLAAAIETDAKYNYMRQEILRGAPPKTEVLPLIPFTSQPTLPPIPAPLPPRDRPTQGPTGPDGAAAECAAARETEPVNDAVTQAPTAPRRVGFAFAKRHGVLVRRVHEGIAECVYRPGAAPLAMAEVRRYLGVPMKLEKVEEATFDSMLRLAYEAGNDAMEAATGVERVHRSAAPGAGHSRAGRPARRAKTTRPSSG